MTEGGKAVVLSCRYHGWSYNMKGGLAKAPGFDTVPGFVPADNGLLPLRIHVDAIGFVSTDAVTFNQQFQNFYQQPRVRAIDLSNFEYDHSWSMEDSVREKGVIYFQSLVKQALVAHHALEVAAGEKIFPAMHQQRGETAEDVFCKRLESSCGSASELTW
ncbi:hypothetical protein P7C70_g4113, partial [Phenoliferia sp. Uapishka_3]